MFINVLRFFFIFFFMVHTSSRYTYILSWGYILTLLDFYIFKSEKTCHVTYILVTTHTTKTTAFYTIMDRYFIQLFMSVPECIYQTENTRANRFNCIHERLAQGDAHSKSYLQTERKSEKGKKKVKIKKTK